MDKRYEEIYKKLDLEEYIKEFKNYFARDKNLYIEGDVNIHKRFIEEISKVDFTPPKEIKNLDSALMYIKKQGILKLYEIFEFVKIIWYFNYLKKQNFPSIVNEWLHKIIVPPQIQEIATYFDDKGNLKPSVDERFIQLEESLKKNKQEIKDVLKRLIYTKKLQPYLVDSQIHYIDDSETLLVRGGFNHVLKGSVVARSSGGYFYVLPQSIDKLKKQQSSLLSSKEELIYEYERKISSTFHKFWSFLNFINREFDRFDHYQARVNFAKIKDFEFISQSRGDEIILKDFAHPALKDPKLINIDFKKRLLLITGVNAGGKTMLLKSILSAVFLSKYLLPFKIDSTNSKIGSFKKIFPIIDDPQSVKDDISTFAGRMSEFSKLFGEKNFIAGVDEIELGTDADEAASLFKVILEKLMPNGKIIVTTHHKRLASIMATDDRVELLAAIYDQERQRPTYEFLKGTIGKSYAFETALRYGISQAIVREAKDVYGEDKEKLNDLIQKNIDLELELKSKLKEVNKSIQKNEKLKEYLKNQKYKADEELKRVKTLLEKEYLEAIDEAKKAAKSQDRAQIHRLLNKADKKKKEALKKEVPIKPEPLKVGDIVKYKKSRGEIISLRKDFAFIDVDGVRMKVPLKELKRSKTIPKKTPKPPKINVQKPINANVQLDLHGLRAEEAIEKLDKYLSDVLVVGYDEVLIYHGVGTGKLAYAVKEFLKKHPKVKNFFDAPANMGGMGATVVKL